jgi:hypothetical protein
MVILLYASGKLPATSDHQHKTKLKQPVSQQAQQFSQFNRDEYLQAGAFESALIGIGRSATSAGQGLKQLYLQSGAKLGWSSQTKADTYARSIGAETMLYESTPVAHSFTGRAAEFAMDATIYSCVPAGAGARGAKLIFSSAAAGGFIGGLQPVADGQWSTRLQNVGIGAIAGGIGAPIVGRVIDASKAGMLKLFDIRRARQSVIATSSPAEIAWGSGTLSARQQALLDALPKTRAQLKLHKSDINVTDLAALTASTGDEFALFTRGSQRLAIRGDNSGIVLSIEKLQVLREQGFRWSAHSHPSISISGESLIASGGDKTALEIFGQERSLILDSFGRRNVFDQTTNSHPDIQKLLVETETLLWRPK